MEPRVLEVETLLYGLISDHKCNLKIEPFSCNHIWCKFCLYCLPQCKLRVYVASVPLLEQSLEIKDMAK